ncbi:hypothetical protein CONPUDRAFT_147773 [Coniophora puteana RWD-64-598 SS2]|uniref:Uncharacterized protein n=1 Tax=Coniophora puteana (strain RWD-64-598) TaxID=741705 RepID=R7SHA1_CONPW|nr:uncharacterized protein CONPUDRAFT_147773 [Coniophora puteana RWD-64-598 SS2]EIW74449.1 hypothetical protein CONPUDRAFT_147773 [Coniophora puteana RWD-64-598 SS2]
MDSIPIDDPTELIHASRSGIDNALAQPEPHLSRYLIENFAKLTDPQGNIVLNWSFLRCVQNRMSVKRLMLGEESSGWDSFAQTCVKAGIVECLLSIARTKLILPEDWESYWGEESYYDLTPPLMATDVIEELASWANETQLQSLSTELSKHVVIDVFLLNMKHKLIVRRLTAARMMDTLSRKLRMGLLDKAPLSIIINVLNALFRPLLQDPKADSTQLIDSNTKWQSYLDDDLKDPVEDGELGSWDNNDVSRKWMASRLFWRIRHHVMRAIDCLINAPPFPSARLWIDILRRNPSILSLLIDCAILERPSYFPESEIGLSASHSLSRLFCWPSYIIPGIPISTADTRMFSQDLKGVVQLLQLLTSQGDWAERILDIWACYEDEDESSLEIKFRRLEELLPERSEEIRRSAFPKILRDCTSTGGCRTAVLRLISTLTHAADQCGMKNVELESFLHVAYNATKWPKRVYDGEDISITVTEDTIGPIALMRILAVLAHRNTLDNLQLLQKAPSGLSPSTSFEQIQQITHPEVVRRAIGISLGRVQERCNDGKSYLAVNDMIQDLAACLSYTLAAELAAAIVAFDANTGGAYAKETQGARKLLVIALGNAAEAWLRMRRWQDAYFCALGAVNAAECIPDSEGLNAAIVAKNKRRVETAKTWLESNS